MVRWLWMLSLFMVSPWQVMRGHPFNCHDRRAGSTWFCKSPRYKRSVADHKIPVGHMRAFVPRLHVWAVYYEHKGTFVLLC